MDADDARRIAETRLAEWNSTLTPNRLEDPRATVHDPEDEYVVTDLVEHSRAWVVHFATKRYLRTRDFLHLVVGTCPLIVDKATGALHVYGSAPEQHAMYEAWLDDAVDGR